MSGKVLDYWFVMVMESKRVNPGVAVTAMRKKVVECWCDWRSKLEGVCPHEIWCVGAVPEEVVDLCRIRLAPRDGRLVMCPVAWREGEKGTDGMDETEEFERCEVLLRALVWVGRVLKKQDELISSQQNSIGEQQELVHAMEEEMESKWYDVEEEMPHNFWGENVRGDCWVRRENGDIELASYCDGVFRDIYSVEDYEGLNVEYYEDVTHWMELEEPVFARPHSGRTGECKREMEG